jgi:hypothetical protein
LTILNGKFLKVFDTFLFKLAEKHNNNNNKTMGAPTAKLETVVIFSPLKVNTSFTDHQFSLFFKSNFFIWIYFAFKTFPFCLELEFYLKKYKLKNKIKVLCLLFNILALVIWLVTVPSSFWVHAGNTARYGICFKCLNKSSISSSSVDTTNELACTLINKGKETRFNLTTTLSECSILYLQKAV